MAFDPTQWAPPDGQMVISGKNCGDMVAASLNPKLQKAGIAPLERGGLAVDTPVKVANATGAPLWKDSQTPFTPQTLAQMPDDTFMVGGTGGSDSHAQFIGKNPAGERGVWSYAPKKGGTYWETFDEASSKIRARGWKNYTATNPMYGNVRMAGQGKKKPAQFNPAQWAPPDQQALKGQEEPGIWGSAKEAFKQSVGELAGTYGSLIGQREGESRQEASKRIQEAASKGLGATGQKPPDTWRGTVGSTLGSLPAPLAELILMNKLLPGGGGMAGSMARGAATFGAQQGLRPEGSATRGAIEGALFGAIPPGAGRLAKGAMGGAIGLGSTYTQPGEKSGKDYAVGGLVPGILAMLGGKAPEAAREPDAVIPPMGQLPPGSKPFQALPGAGPQLGLPAPEGFGPEGDFQYRNMRPGETSTKAVTGPPPLLALPPAQGFTMREPTPETRLRKAPKMWQAVEEKPEQVLRQPPTRTLPGQANILPTAPETLPVEPKVIPAKAEQPTQPPAPKEPWEMTASEHRSVLDDIVKSGEQKANEVPKVEDTANREIQYKLEKGKLDKLQRQFDSTQMPSEDLRKRIAAQKEKVDGIAGQAKAIDNYKREKFAVERSGYLQAAKDKYQHLIDAGMIDVNDSNKDFPITVKNHKDLVKQALAKGKPVPPEVLKDYPDLAPPAKGGDGVNQSTYDYLVKKIEEQRKAKDWISLPAKSQQAAVKKLTKYLEPLLKEFLDTRKEMSKATTFDRLKQIVEGMPIKTEAKEPYELGSGGPSTEKVVKKVKEWLEDKYYRPTLQDFINLSPDEFGKQMARGRGGLYGAGQMVSYLRENAPESLKSSKHLMLAPGTEKRWAAIHRKAMAEMGESISPQEANAAQIFVSSLNEAKQFGFNKLSALKDEIESQTGKKISWEEAQRIARERQPKMYSGGPGYEDIKAAGKKVRDWWGEREPLTVGGHTWGAVKYSIGKYFGATKTPEGTKAKTDVTRMAGRWQADKLQAEALFGDAESRYAGLDRQGFVKLVSPIQRGGKSSDPAFQKLYDLYHDTSDKLWEKINQYKPLSYLNDYFRQSWTNADDPAIQENIKNYFAGRPFINYLQQDAQGKPQMDSRPYGGKTLTGGRSYFKQRVIPDVETGMMLGLQAREMNPVRNMLNDIAEKSHFVRGMELWDDYFKAKTIKYYRPGSQPGGWQPINDPMGKVSIPYLQKVLEKRAQKTQAPGVSTKTGKPVEANVLEWQAYAPEEVARTFNNWLGKGFRGEPWYDAYRGIVDPLRKIGVSLSTFHLKMTLNTDMAMRSGSHMSKAIGHLMTGDPVNAAKEAKMLGRTWSGEQFIRGQYLGKGLLAELLSPGQHPELREVAMDMRDSGLLPTSAKSLRPWIQASKGALKEAAMEGYGTLKNLATGHPLKAVQSGWRGFDKFLDATAAPIMEYGVPRAKAAAFAFLRKGWLNETGKKYGGVENIPREVKAQGMYDIARHVDHMMGQINYDALHFNRKLRDLLFFAIKYPGWNIGSAAWMATGAKGIGKKLTGQAMTTLDRTAMRTTLGLLASVGVTGLVTQYLLTGKLPDNPADIYTKGIETGYKDDSGRPEYVRDATYLKDLQSVLHDPVRTLQSKSPDIFRVLAEIRENSDYFGTDIRTPGAGVGQQAGELGAYLGKNLALPYSMRNVSASESPFAKFGSFGGYSPTPRWLKESPLETTLSDASHRRTFKQTRQQAESRDLEKTLVKQYRKDKDPAALQRGLAEAQHAGKLTGRQADQTFKNAPIAPDIMRFWKSPVDVALQAFERGTVDEKKKYGRLLEEKLNRAVKGRPEWIQENQERIRRALQEIPQ